MCGLDSDDPRTLASSAVVGKARCLGPKGCRAPALEFCGRRRNMNSRPLQAETPLLGSAGRTTTSEIELSHRFDQLHQLLYVQGGIKPSNAALEELEKLMLLKLWTIRDPRGSSLQVNVASIFDGSQSSSELVETTKSSFKAMLSRAALGSHDPQGVALPIWPVDEPFRLDNPEVLQVAAAIVDDLLDADCPGVADPLGTAFDAFLSGRYNHAGGLGTFLTPSSVARFMTDVALSITDPLEGWDGQRAVVADPFCGTGRFLVSAFDAFAERGEDEEILQNLLNTGIVGADQSGSAVAKATLNLLLYGADSPTLFRVQDSVVDSNIQFFDSSLKLILTNPPFGGGKYSSREGIELASSRIPSLSKKESIDPALACLVKSADLLAPGGLLAIVLPDGIIEGRQFSDFMANSPGLNVVANVSLPTATFALSGTVAKTSSIFMRKAAKSKRVVLAQVKHVGFLKQAGQAAPDPEGNDLTDLSAHLSRALTFEDAIEPMIAISNRPLVATVQTEGLTNYSPSRLDPSAVRARAALQTASYAKLSSILRPAKKLRSSSGITKPFISVLHVDEYGTINWPEAEHYAPVTNGQLASGGNIIVSLLNPSKLRAAVLPANIGTVMCSLEFGVFEAVADPYLALATLYHPDVQAQLKPLGRGTSSSRRRIDSSELLELVIPKYNDKDAILIAKSVSSAIAGIENGRTELSKFFSRTTD